MKMKYLALLAAVVVLLGAIFFVAPDAKAAATHDCTGSHCACNGKAAGVGEHTACETGTWVEVTTADALKSALTTASDSPVYIRLGADIDISGESVTMASGNELSICLNGWKLTSKDITVKGTEGNRTVLSITDCQYNETTKDADGVPVGGQWVITTNQISLQAYGTVNLYAGSLVNSSKGTLVYANTGSCVVNIYGGYATSTKNGTAYRGMFAIMGAFNMHGGTIDGNGWEYCGALVASGVNTSNKPMAATITITGGTIKNGTTKTSTSAYARGLAGNIYVGPTSKLVISGGTITGGVGIAGSTTNSSATTIGTYPACKDIFCAGTLSISGNPVIGELYSVGETNKSVLETFAANAGYEVIASGADYILTPHKHCVCNGKVTGHECEEVSWTPVGTAAEFTAAYKGGCHIILTADIDLGDTTMSGWKGERSICLNGHELKSSYEFGFIVGTTTNAGTLNITDCKYNGTTGGTLNAKISVRKSSTLNVYGGILTNTHGDAAVEQSGTYTGNTFNLYNGTVTAGEGNRAIYVGKENTFNMYGGVVTGGATANGGNIYAVGNVTISGGTISGGTATSEGGNIWISGDLTVSGTALIKDGTANNGGNIYTEGNVTISGGTIQDGTATGNYGGNIQMAGPKAVDQYNTFTMTAGTITRGTVNAYNGGNIALQGVKATISGGTISDGTRTGTNTGSYRGGGNIALNSGELTISGTAVISGGTSSNNGGNIVVRYADGYLPTKLLITGGTVSGGVAENTGGNIHVYSVPTADYTPEVEITGGTISGGSALKGGALYVNDTMNANVVIKDCTIKGNTSTDSETGAIDLRGDTNATLGGVLVFEDNGVDLALRTANTKVSVAEITAAAEIKLSVRYEYVFTTDANADGYVTFVPVITKWSMAPVESGDNAGFWQSIENTVVFEVAGEDYYTVEEALEAIASMEAGSKIAIRVNNFNFTLSVDALVNIAGMTGTITLENGAVLTAYDSASNDYDETRLGKLTVVMGEGGGSVAAKYALNMSSGIRKYLTVANDDGTYSFHRYYLSITYLGVNPASKGLGVKATFAGTKTIRDMMVAGGFGVVYGAEGVTYDTALGQADIKTEVKFGNAGSDAVYTASFVLTGAYTEPDLTTSVYFRAFANLGDTAVESDIIVKINPTDVLTKINAAWNGDAEGYTTTDDQKAAIQAMCAEINTDAFNELKATLTNIVPVESGDAVVAAIPVAKKKYGVNI